MASDTSRRYLQLGVLTLAAGAVYPLIYLRQNFEVSILETFEISVAQLGQCYSILGVIFMATYLPSGWLADRVAPRGLVALSLGMTGLLGAWFATVPSFSSLLVIFTGWGVFAGLTFWAALIKAVAVLGHHDEQGRFFGILDGGRGLVEALLASIAVGWFAYSLSSLDQPLATSLVKVIYLYVAFALLLAPLVYFAIDDVRAEQPEALADQRESSRLWQDLKLILGKEEVWLAALCINCGYQLFWATYSFSGYLQNMYGMTAVAVGIITVAKLWMRPIGAVVAGFVGDRYNREKTLAGLMFAGTVSLAALIVLPAAAGAAVLLAVVLLVGLMTYAIRGIFWSTLDSCNIAVRIKGLAIGVMSLIGYSPDIYLPLLNGYLLERFPDKIGYSLYFSVIVGMGIVGTMAAWRLHILVRRAATASES